MKIHEAQTSSCPFGAAIRFAESFFVACDKTRQRVTGATQLGDLMPSCQVVVDSTDSARRHDALKLTWSHQASFLPPDFNGSLTVRPASGESELTLEGSHDWQPGAPTNGLDLDNVARLVVARAAMRLLLQRIVSHVEAEWSQFVHDCPSIAMCNAQNARTRS